MKFSKIFKSIFLAGCLSFSTLAGHFFPSFEGFDSCCGEQTKQNFVLYGEALYWTARQENALFANETFVNSATSRVEETEIDSTDLRFRSRDFHHKWTPGFRIGAGYSGCDNWETYATWTHFHNHACKHGRGFTTTTTPSGTLSSSDSFNPYVASADVGNLRIGSGGFLNLFSRWKLDFDTVDWVFGKDFSYCNYHVIPFFGFKFDRIEQQVCYFGASATSTSSTADGIRVNTLYEGGGITTGMDTFWDVGCGIQINGNLGFGWTYGYMRSKLRENSASIRRTRFLTLMEDTHISLKHSEHIGRVNLDFGIGLSGEYPIFDCANLVFNIGYEYHQYFSQNFFGYDFPSGPLQGDLVMQGGVFGLGLEF